MTPTRAALLVLAGWADEIATPAFATATWGGGKANAAGVIQVPYATYPERLHAFTSDMYRVALVHSFDWMAWAGTPRARELLESPVAVAGATAEELAQLLTTVIRAERFNDGAIEAEFDKGVVQAVARRAHVLLDLGHQVGPPPASSG